MIDFSAVVFFRFIAFMHLTDRRMDGFMISRIQTVKRIAAFETL